MLEERLNYLFILSMINDAMKLFFVEVKSTLLKIIRKRDYGGISQHITLLKGLHYFWLW